NCSPAGDSESKSMISRWKSSIVAAVAAGSNAKVAGGGGVAIGSKPRFLSTHLRSTFMARSAGHHEGRRRAQYRGREDGTTLARDLPPRSRACHHRRSALRREGPPWRNICWSASRH